MNFNVFGNAAQARAFLAAINLACGYPSQGVRINAGIHGPGGQTTAHGYLIKNRRQPLWAHPDDDVVVSKRPIVPLPAGVTPGPLSSDWNDAEDA